MIQRPEASCTLVAESGKQALLAESPGESARLMCLTGPSVYRLTPLLGCVIWKPQNQRRPRCEDADEESRDKCDFHDNLLGLRVYLSGNKPHKSDDSLGHLYRQVGSAQAHMGFGGSVTLNSEISQLSIGLTFSLLHLGQSG